MKNQMVVGIYCRLSEEDRDKNGNVDSQSIRNQKELLIDYTIKNNWYIYDVYSDDDYSGASRNRPEWLRLINDCEKGVIDIVLCKSLSRFSREIEITEKYINRLFVEWGIRFIGLADCVDTERSGSRRSMQINSLTNEWYLEDCSNNVRKVLKHKAEKGEFIGSFASYGYKKDPLDKHHLIIDDEAASIVKQIFDWSSAGIGGIAIARKLNEQKIVPPSVYKQQNGSNYHNRILNYPTGRKIWTASTICRMLVNEVYIGNTVQGKFENLSFKVHKKVKVPKEKWIRVEHTHEPIIDMQTWNIVQSMRQIRTRNGRASGSPAPLNRKIFCPRCGAVMRREHSSCRGVSYQYLRCATRRTSDNCDNLASIRLDDVEFYVVNEINKLLECYLDKDKIVIVRNNNDKKAQILKQINKLESEIKQNEDKVYDLYQDKFNKIITEVQFLDFNKRIQAEISSKKAIMENLDDTLSKIKDNNKEVNDINMLLSKYQHIDKLTPYLVEEFIDIIYIDKVDDEITIEIHWDF